MLKKILILGTGRSSFHLIEHLYNTSKAMGWEITLADISEQKLLEIRDQKPEINLVLLEPGDDKARDATIEKNDVVISLLPPAFHPAIAMECLNYRKHLLTASYVSPEMKDLGKAALENGLLFLNECGLDPGIDHMSAMEIIDNLREKGADIHSFQSFTGGLVAPESDNNPWNYKISWNPMNVVKAGQGTALFRKNGKEGIIPYHKLFYRTEEILIPEYGSFEGYINRNSLPYLEKYSLQNCSTLVRGTLRKKGFCQSWAKLVDLGITDDTVVLPFQDKSYRDLTRSFLPEGDGPTEEILARYLDIDPSEEVFSRIKWLGIMDDTSIPLNEGTPAMALKELLVRKMAMEENDKDLVVMVHSFQYSLEGKEHYLKSYLTLEGENSIRTAMSKTVGLPLAFATELLMKGEITLRGVQIPNKKEIYGGILSRLAEQGIVFREEKGLVNN